VYYTFYRNCYENRQFLMRYLPSIRYSDNLIDND
jgi:hypothetical protein